MHQKHTEAHCLWNKKKVRWYHENGLETCEHLSTWKWYNELASTHNSWSQYTGMESDVSYNGEDWLLPYDIFVILLFKFCNFTMIINVIITHWRIFLILRLVKDIWVQELDISNVNVSNFFFIFTHKPQTWKFVMWYTFRNNFNLCENTWRDACLNQSKMFSLFFSKF
jgi:hypothetical protein